MQYEDRSASGYARRRAQKAIASTYAPSDPPKSLDSSVLTALRQGQQTIVRTPITTVCDASGSISRDDPGCCCSFPPVTILNITQNQQTNPVEVTVTWLDDPNAISYEILLDVVTGTNSDDTLFEAPSRNSVTGALSSTIQTFQIGIRAVYSCKGVVSWTGIQTLTGSAP